MRHPIGLRALAAVATVVATLAVGATRARADVPPPDSCTSPGQTCMNAGPQFDQAGTCVATTCSKQVPAPDGGMTSMTYACNRCTAGGGGADGGGGSGGAGGSTSPSSKSSGCTVAPERGDGESLAGTMSMCVLGGLILAAARRRNGGE